MARLIKTKRQFYDLAKRGLCGNTPKTWESVDEYLLEADRYPRVGVRRLTPGAQGTKPGLTSDQVKSYISKCGLNEGDYVITRTQHLADDGRSGIRALQGELSWVIDRWVLFHVYHSGYMRDMLSRCGKHISGWEVVEMIRQSCSNIDADDIFELFKKYTIDGQYPVIEFSVLQENIGEIQGRNTVIWEIRHY